MGPSSLSPSKGKDLLHRFLLHLHHLHLLLRTWQVHLTLWKKSKHPHLLHLPSKDKIGGARFSAEIIGYNPYYYGKTAHP
jgi:hypothetical protein